MKKANKYIALVAVEIINIVLLQWLFVRLRIHERIVFGKLNETAFSHLSFQYFVPPLASYLFEWHAKKHYYIELRWKFVNNMRALSKSSVKYRNLRRIAIFKHADNHARLRMIRLYLVSTPLVFLHEMSHAILVAILKFQQPTVVLSHWAYVYYDKKTNHHTQTTYNVHVVHKSNNYNIWHNIADICIGLAPFIFYVITLILLYRIDLWYEIAFISYAIIDAHALMPSSNDYTMASTHYKYLKENISKLFKKKQKIDDDLYKINIHAADTPPEIAENGTVWYNTSTRKNMIYNDGDWISIQLLDIDEDIMSKVKI